MNLIKTQAKNLYYKVLLNKDVRHFLEKLPLVGERLAKKHRTHPIDFKYGVDTSGVYPVELIHADQQMTSKIIPYVGSQPSVPRAAIAWLRDIEDYTFVDLGCGKGRVLIVASEFPFKEIIGVELSPDLARIGKANAQKIAADYPERAPIRIIEGDAIASLIDTGKVVFYLYHSFGPELLQQLIERIEKALESTLEHIFFVYHNPVWGGILDSSPALVRWQAQTVAFSPAEAEVAIDPNDNVIIWQSRRNAYPDPYPEADREIIITKELWRAELKPSVPVC